ncbi:MAG TPA: DUF6786 family protein [Phycisphaeraceae bacterium]
MAADWFDRLRTTLDSLGHRTWAWPAGHGRLLVSEYGARLLACELPPAADNIFWHNTALESADTAPQVLAAAGGSIGGDRLWIAPEISFMWPDLQLARQDSISTYNLPAAMDPAAWKLRQEGPAHALFATTMRLQDHRFKRSLAIEATRQFSIIDRPAGIPDDLPCLSFAIANQITLTQADPGAVAGGWDLLQVPPTGTLICPTVTPVPSPRSYFNPFGPRHVQSSPHAVRFLIDGRRRIKMGLLAEQTTGRMAYYRALAQGQSSLIVRIFAPQPGEPYADLPLDTTELLGGDTLQAYNDDGSFGGFGEMEYHDPALIAGKGPQQRRGACVTHILAGPDEAVRLAGHTLLGVPIEPIA